MFFKNKLSKELKPDHPNDALIEFKNITKLFKSGHVRNFALDNVSFILKPGESISIVGESGSGKSTLGLVATNLLRPNSGAVYFEGKDISRMRGNKLRAFRRNIQMVFQDPYSSLNPFNTIFQSVVTPLKYNWKYYNEITGRQVDGRPSRETMREEVASMLDRVGLSPGVNFLDAYPRKLSGGQRQRVVVARSLIARPKLVVADEPTSMLDVSISAQILNLMSDLKKEFGFSIMYISHEIATARYISEKMAVLNLGRIVEYGPSDDVAFHPLHPYTDILIRSMMEVGKSRSEEIPIKMDFNVYNGGVKGCTFAHSCPFRKDLCTEKNPELTDVGNGHYVACFYPLSN